MENFRQYFFITFTVIALATASIKGWIKWGRVVF